MSTTVISTSVPGKTAVWAETMRRWTDYFVKDFGNGPRPWKFAWVINFQKTGTFPLLAFLIARYHNNTTAAWIYLAMHGTYGLVSIIKDVAFPDRTWQVRITILGGINAFISVLCWYWVFGWLLISRRSQPNYPLPANSWFCLCLTLCILGVAIMIAADAQKYFTLRLQPGLITNGMFRYVRHPNYLRNDDLWQLRADGLALAAVRCAGLGLGGLFAVNISLKEASMSRYPDWEEYKRHTWLLLPLAI